MIIISSTNKTDTLLLSQFINSDHFNPYDDYNVDMVKINDWSKNVLTTTSGTAVNSSKFDNKSIDEFVLADTTNYIWQPTLCGATTVGTPTYTTQTGYYYKAGKQCYIYCKIVISAKNDMDGLLEIGGLPLTVLYNSKINVISYSGVSDLSGIILPYAEADSTKIFLGQSVTNTGTSNNVITDKILDTFSIELSGVYLTSI